MSTGEVPLASTSEGTLHIEERDGELIVRVTGAAVERVLAAQQHPFLGSGTPGLAGRIAYTVLEVVCVFVVAVFIFAYIFGWIR